MKKISVIALGAIALLAACSGGRGWKVDGNLRNANDSTVVVLESFNGVNWYAIDTLSVRDGKFSYVSPQGAAAPDVYRLTLDGRSIYFPIDSIETISVDANAAAFDSDYQLAGSEMAEAMAQIDKQIVQAVASQGVQGALNDSILKASLNNAALSDTVGVIAYYIVNKTIGGEPLYSTSKRKDVAMLGAVANKLILRDANDPRGKLLSGRFLQARREAGMAQNYAIEAPETGLVEISLFDDKGQQQDLSKVAADAGVTLLSFTNYNLEGSLPYNVELNRLYQLFKDRRIAIYQVSIDADEVSWRQAAVNLPWVTVRNDASDAGNYLNLYNVDVLPLTFVIDGNGDLQKRVVDPAELEAAIRAAL